MSMRINFFSLILKVLPFCAFSISLCLFSTSLADELYEKNIIISLGKKGSVTIPFNINTNKSSLTITVFEGGPAKESTYVYVSINGVNHKIGTASGGTKSLNTNLLQTMSSDNCSRFMINSITLIDTGRNRYSGKPYDGADIEKITLRIYDNATCEVANFGVPPERTCIIR